MKEEKAKWPGSNASFIFESSRCPNQNLSGARGQVSPWRTWEGEAPPEVKRSRRRGRGKGGTSGRLSREASKLLHALLSLVLVQALSKAEEEADAAKTEARCGPSVTADCFGYPSLGCP